MFDGSCPTCGNRHIERSEFTYAHEGEALSGLTCMATCGACNDVWVEVYKLDRILRDESTSPEPAKAASPVTSAAPPPLGRVTAKRAVRKTI